jgi:hypothetical protein
VDYQTQFALMVNGTLDFNSFLNLLHQTWADREWLTRTTFARDRNFARVRRNKGAEPANSDATDPLDYPYEIQVTPNAGSVGVEEQVALAKQMRSELEALGLQVAVVADFEELL